MADPGAPVRRCPAPGGWASPSRRASRPARRPRPVAGRRGLRSCTPWWTPSHGHAVAGTADRTALQSKNSSADICPPGPPRLDAKGQSPNQLAPPQWALNCGPPVTTIVGRSTLAAPMSWAGVVLSQPPRQHDAVERVGPQHFFDVHGHEVAQEHRRGPDHLFAQGDGRELEGQAARFPDTPLHRLGHRSQVRVAGRQLRPAVGYADHGRADACPPASPGPRGRSDG